LMHAVHVIAGLRSGDGGPAYSVPRLCRALAKHGAEVDLVTVSTGAAETKAEGSYCERSFTWDFAKLPVLRELRASSDLRRALRQARNSAEVIHDHGLWVMPNLYAGWEAARADKPLVVAPRGMLNPVALSFSRRKKQAFWRLLQHSAVARAACFHATSEQEYLEIRTFGLEHPVAVIPNGIDVPEQRAAVAVRPERTLLCLGRIHPIKGLDTLLSAWARIAPLYPYWRLRIVGPGDDDYRQKLLSFIRAQDIPRVSLGNAVYGDDKARLFADASLFVVPSLNESFAITVAEALAAALPVITTKGTPWSGLTDQQCGWWVDHGVEPLAAALKFAMQLPPEALVAMGQKGRDWATREFSWQRVAREMLAVYGWISGTADRPTCIRTDR